MSPYYLPMHIDRRAWMLYSWWRLPRGANVPPVHSCFSEPLGPGLEETNIFRGHQLPEPKAFVIFSFHALCWNMWEEDRLEFRSRYMLEIQIGQKIFQQAPLSILADEPKFIERPKPGQMPQPGYFPDDYPLIIPAMVRFDVLLKGGPISLLPGGDLPGRGLNHLVVLNGIMDFPVQ